jgi:hypothetical protein
MPSPWICACVVIDPRKDSIGKAQQKIVRRRDILISTVQVYGFPYKA